MDGFLDELNQAWLNLDFGQGRADFLIDTGFAGTLIVEVVPAVVEKLAAR